MPRARRMARKSRASAREHPRAAGSGAVRRARTITLYDLVLQDGTPFSPFVWRVKYALAHKGLAFTTVPVGYLDVPTLCGGGHRTVPIIDDAGEVVGDSWRIVDFLDARYGDPRILATRTERAMVRLIDHWYAAKVAPVIFRLVALHILIELRPADQDYFRRTREQRIGATLESLESERAARIDSLRELLGPLRTSLAEGPFLAGESPNYADYIAFSAFRWIGAVTPVPVLKADDPLAAWVRRGYGLFGGLGFPEPRRRLIE